MRQLPIALKLVLALLLGPSTILAQESKQENSSKAAALHFKELAGPPTEFGAMAPVDPLLTATHSKSALLPVTLESNGSEGWIWDAALHIEGGGSRMLVFSGPPGSSASPWDLMIKDSATGVVQSPESLGVESLPTQFGLAENTFPAEMYDLGSLALGDWQVVIKSNKPGRGYLLMEGGGSTRLLSYQADFNQRVGEWISIVATTYDADAGFDATGLDGVSSALLRVTTPDGRRLTSTMHDDGLHQDNEPGDGVYGGEFLADRPGDFKAQVLLTGFNGTNGSFVRTTEHLIPVVDESVRLQGQVAGSSMLNDRRLRISLDVSTPETAKHYRVFAEVWGTDPLQSEVSRPVAWVGGMAVVDDGSLHLGLDTRWITISGAREPFELRNVRVEDPNHFITLSSAERMPLAIPSLPAIGLPSDPIVVDSEMLVGPRPAFLDTVSGSKAGVPQSIYESGAGHILLLVHGYCSSNVWGPVGDQFDNSGVFFDLEQNRTHDEFAQGIKTAALSWNSYSIVAHSQGGMAALHLYNYYWSGLDNAGPGRLIQSVGTPYQGTPLAGILAVLGEIYFIGCGTNFNLTPFGAASWLAGISSSSRAKVDYYTTSFALGPGNDYCHLGTDLLLDDPEDGVVEQGRGQLSGGSNRGHTVGWCHSAGMRDPAQTTDSIRNAVMNANAAIGSQDLIVTEMGVSDTTLETGESFTASATVENQGGATSVSTTLRYYRSTNPTISTFDMQLSTDLVSSLSPGGSSPESASVSIGAAGINWVGACVDSVTDESNTNNNCSSGVQVTVSSPASPDLIVTSMSVNDTTLETGQSFTASATVQNQGTGASNSTTLRYFRSPDATISTSDFQLSTDPVSSLSPGGASPESASVSIGAAGTYWVGACVDSVASESNTSNNCSSGVQVAVSSPTSPDLIVTSMSVNDTTLETGQSFTASATVQNQGTGASNSTTLRYFRSPDATISTSDFQLSTDPVSSLSPGGASPESASVSIGTAGTYWVGACVDSVASESNTSNNCSSSVQVTVSTPPGSCSYHLTSPNGGESWVTGTAHTIQWSTSGDECASTVRLELHKGGASYDVIDTSTSNDGSQSWTISSGFPNAGDYTVEVIDNANSSYNDTSDSNFSITGATPGPWDFLLYAGRQACLGARPAILLGWHMPAGAEPEVTVRRTDGEYTAVVDTSVEGPVHLVERGLQHGSNYDFTVEGTVGGSPSVSNTVRAYVVADTCLLPVGPDDPPHRPILWADPPYCEGGVEKVRLRWTPVAGAVSYRIVRSGWSIGGNSQFENLIGTSVVDDDVLAGGAGYYQLYATSAVGDVAGWGFAVFVPGTTCADPGHPGAFSASADDPTCSPGGTPEVEFSWTAAADALPGYRAFALEDHSYTQSFSNETGFAEGFNFKPGTVGRIFVQAESDSTPGQFREAPTLATLMPQEVCGAATELPAFSLRDARWVGANSAQISVGVYPNRSPTMGYLEWGLDGSYGNITPLRAIGAGKGAIRQYIGEDLDGLACGTVYHYRAAATNDVGPAVSTGKTFTTDACPVPPVATTNPGATGVTQTQATINGSVNPNSRGTDAGFDYGISEAYGAQIGVGNVGSGSSFVPIEATLNTLVCGRTYHFRAWGTSLDGTGYGLGRAFSTEPCCPGEHVVDGLLVQDEMTIEACESIRVLDVDVATGASLVLRAGHSVALGEGLIIRQDSDLTVEIDPSMLP